MNGSRVATSSFGTAVWLVLSVGMLLWVALTVSAILEQATRVLTEVLR